jgi:hypothetical protein
MGADLIGYLVKGPAKIPESRIKAAVRKCLKQRQTLLDDAGKGANRGQRMDVALSATGEYFDPEEIPENPEAEIREFVDWWHGMGGRDTCCRTDPDNPREMLVFAGDMSWGDEPDGYGYQMLKRAHTWGVAEALGLR